MALFGYTSEEAVGREVHALLAPADYHDAFASGLAKFSKTGQAPVVSKILQLTALRKDRTEFPMELSVSSVQLQRKWHGVGIIRDITERRQAKQALRESEARLARESSLDKSQFKWEKPIKRFTGIEVLTSYQQVKTRKIGKERAYEMIANLQQATRSDLSVKQVHERGSRLIISSNKDPSI